jgi:hypothetical protein
MARGGKFKLNRRTVRHIMREDDKLGEALVDVAEEMKDRAGPTATIDEYKTDRQVAGIVVGANEQARDGVATRAAQQTAANRARPFRSRAEWRHAYATAAANASRRARASRGWASLPERAPGGRRG